MSTTVGAAAVDGRAIARQHTTAAGRNGPTPAPLASAEPRVRTPTGHVIMCGLDGIGARIAEQLTRAGESVVVLSEFAGPAHAAILQGQSITVVDPVGGVAQTLDAAGIDRAKAVICVTGDDLKNLEFALLARRRRPEVRVVTPLGNMAIGRAMRDGGGPGAVLDVAALAAPAIVAACLSREIHEVAVEHQQFQVAIVPVGSDSTLRHVFGDLAPVPWSGNGPMVLPRSSPARAGTSLWRRGTGPRCSGPPPTSAARTSTWNGCRTPRPIATGVGGGPA